MAEFKKRVFGENVPKDIQTKIKKLASGGFKTQGGDGIEGGDLNPIFDPQQPSFEKYLGERTPITRMWTAVSILNYTGIPPYGENIETENGEHFYYPLNDKKKKKVVLAKDSDADIRYFTVNQHDEKNTYTDPLRQRKSIRKIQEISQLSEKNSNQFLKPAAGITSVTSKTEGALGAIQRTIVEFIVHNRHDFENIFLPYFMRPGSIVCVDYGWSDVELYNPRSHIDAKDIEMREFDEFIYGEPKQKKGFLRKPKHLGKINTTLGNVVSYDSTVTPEGSFQCSIEVVSRNASILDKELSDDNKLKFLFASVIDDLLVEVLMNAIKVTPDTTEEFGEGYVASAQTFQNLSLKDIEYLLNSSVDINTDQDTKAFFSALSDGTELGVITENGLKVGIFHQHVKWDQWTSYLGGSVKLKGNDARDTIDAEETTYIAWGLFEDLFLNNFVIGAVETSADGENPVIFEKDYDNDYSNRFDSRNSFVRWDEDLAAIQRQDLISGEQLTPFLIPDQWDATYNFNRVKPKASDFGIKNAETGWYTELCKSKRFPNYETKQVIPFRDVFVSVGLIQAAFRQADSLNDALIFILDELSSSTTKVWNLKMRAGPANTKISIQDVNLFPQVKKKEEMLIFDVTSETSIVSNLDLKFTTPKDGLSSILAIGNLQSPTYIDQMVMGSLNYLNLLNKPEGKENFPTVVRSLPIQGSAKKPLIEQVGKLDYQNFRNIVETFDEEINITGAKTVYETYLNYQQSINKKVKKAKEQKEQAWNINPKRLEKFVDLEILDSPREYYKKIINTKYNGADNDASISPILPIELNLTVYGNTFLQIGDYFSINYLPEYYRDRVFFQIYGIEDKVDVNGWQTTYNPCVMRVQPDKKGIANAGNPMSMMQKSLRYKTRGSRAGLGAVKNWMSLFLRVDDHMGKEEIIDDYMVGVQDIKFKDKNLNKEYGLTFKAFHIKCRPYSDWLMISDDNESQAAGTQEKNASRYLQSSGEKNQNFDSVRDLALSLAVRDALLKKGVLNFEDLDRPVNVTNKTAAGDQLAHMNSGSPIIHVPPDQLNQYYEFEGEMAGKFGFLIDGISRITPKKDYYEETIAEQDLFFVNYANEKKPFNLGVFNKPNNEYATFPAFVSKIILPLPSTGYSYNSHTDEKLASKYTDLTHIEIKGRSCYNNIFIPDIFLRPFTTNDTARTAEQIAASIQVLYKKYEKILQDLLLEELDNTTKKEKLGKTYNELIFGKKPGFS
tara:strand:+ start:4203 stop:7910 length:3708 start_codon:yes stop_codon:yes gene_type:complete